MLNKYLNITNQTNKIFISDYGSRNVLRALPSQDSVVNASVSGPIQPPSTSDGSSAPANQTSVQMITALKDKKITLQQILDKYNEQQKTIPEQSREESTSSNSSQDNTVTGKFNELNDILSNVSSPSDLTSEDHDQVTLKATLEKIIDEQYEDFTKKNPSLIYKKNEVDKTKLKELFKDHSAYFFLDTLKKLDASYQYKDEIKAEELLSQFKNKYSKFLNEQKFLNFLMHAVLNSENKKYHVNANEYSTSIFSDLINTMRAGSLTTKKEVFDKKYRPKLLESEDGAVKYMPRKVVGIAFLLLGLVATTGLFLAAAFTSNVALVGGALSLPTISGISAILALASVVGTVVAIGKYKIFDNKQLTSGNLANRITKTQQKAENNKFNAIKSNYFSPVRDLLEESKPQTTEKEPPVANAKKETHLFDRKKSFEENVYEISRKYKDKPDGYDLDITGAALNDENKQIIKNIAKQASSLDEKESAKEFIVETFIVEWHTEFKNSDRDLTPYQELAEYFHQPVTSSSEKQVPVGPFNTAIKDKRFIAELKQRCPMLHTILDSKYNLPQISHDSSSALMFSEGEVRHRANPESIEFRPTESSDTIPQDLPPFLGASSDAAGVYSTPRVPADTRRGVWVEEAEEAGTADRALTLWPSTQHRTVAVRRAGPATTRRAGPATTRRASAGAAGRAGPATPAGRTAAAGRAGPATLATPEMAPAAPAPEHRTVPADEAGPATTRRASAGRWTTLADAARAAALRRARAAAPASAFTAAAGAAAAAAAFRAAAAAAAHAPADEAAPAGRARAAAAEEAGTGTATSQTAKLSDRTTRDPFPKQRKAPRLALPALRAAAGRRAEAEAAGRAEAEAPDWKVDAGTPRAIEEPRAAPAARVTFTSIPAHDATVTGGWVAATHRGAAPATPAYDLRSEVSSEDEETRGSARPTPTPQRGGSWTNPRDRVTSHPTNYTLPILNRRLTRTVDDPSPMTP